MKNEENIYDTIDYLTDGEVDHIVFLEDICREFNIDVEKYWIRDATKEDWFAQGDYVITRTKPILIEEYQHGYSLLINSTNKNLVLFADSIISTLIENWGYLEACYNINTDKKNKKKEKKNDRL